MAKKETAGGAKALPKPFPLGNSLAIPLDESSDYVKLIPLTPIEIYINKQRALKETKRKWLDTSEIDD